MESTSSLATCSNPGCDQPGTNLCSACKSTPYCGPICQTADWTHHREECPGHLLKLGMANIAKAEEFHRANNWPQTLRFGGARELARALWNFALRGGVMPPKEKQETGVEAIMLARRALAIHTQLYGAESLEVAGSSDVLANCIKYFNPSEEDEVIHLFKQALSIYRRLEGNDSPNVGVNLNNLGIVYNNRGARKGEAGQFNQYIANLELALPCFRDATRIARANNLVELADKAEQKFVDVRERLRLESRKR